MLWAMQARRTCRKPVPRKAIAKATLLRPTIRQARKSAMLPYRKMPPARAWKASRSPFPISPARRRARTAPSTEPTTGIPTWLPKTEALAATCSSSPATNTPSPTSLSSYARNWESTPIPKPTRQKSKHTCAHSTTSRLQAPRRFHASAHGISPAIPRTPSALSASTIPSSPWSATLIVALNLRASPASAIGLRCL